MHKEKYQEYKQKLESVKSKTEFMEYIDGITDITFLKKVIKIYDDFEKISSLTMMDKYARRRVKDRLDILTGGCQ